MSKLPKEVLDAFLTDHEIISIKGLVSGHINDTYLVKTDKGRGFVVQRINNVVFKDIPGLVRNKTLVSEHLQKKKGQGRNVLSFVKSSFGSYYFEDKKKGFWNTMVYIDNSQTFEIVREAKIAYEGGKLFGDFLNLTEDFDASKLTEVIPQFHDMSFRYSQFEASLKIASEERLFSSKSLIEKVEEFKTEMHILQELKDNGSIRLRVTHNDTKISNALFDMQGKGLCVIDTDTVMPGIIHYDFGDAIRTICNTAAEDETDLNLVHFNLPYYEAYLKGFLEKTKSSLSDLEIKYLPLGAKSMIFIMALRFLTDYLNGNIYYKIKYPEHNLDRAKNQFKLIQDFDKKMGELQGKI